MYIQSFHIDNFGVFSQISVEGLSEGLTIFLGKNEAGKSTCLEFLRTMLTGYPHTRSKEAQGRQYTRILPGKTGQAGGSLGIHLEDRGLVHITRRPDKGRDSLTISDAQGNVLESSLLDGLLSGVTREVYRNVFGFSLTELQVFDSLKDEGVRHALYGASFGMGLRSPGTVLKELESHMEKLFKAKGSTPYINDTLKNLERVQKEIQTLKQECAQYDTLSLTQKTLEEGLALIRQQKSLAEQQRRDAERQLGVWKQWDEWRKVENQLSRLAPVAESFPEDGAGRMERAQLLCQEAARRMNTQKERCQTLKSKRDSLIINTELLEKRHALQALSEQKSSFRQAQEGLAPQEASIHRMQGQLTQTLAELGPHWTCQRIHATNRSLVARSELERLAADIQATEQAHVAGTTNLEKANASVLAARHTLELAQNTLLHLAVPKALVNDETRQHMRRYVAHIENSTAALAEKEQALITFKKTFQRTLAPLSLRTHSTKPQSVKDILPILEALRDAQEGALAWATQAQEARKNTHDVELLVAQVQEKEESARARVERMRMHLQKNVTTSRVHIDTRAKAIRALRQLHVNHALEKERLQELAQRMALSTPPEPVKSVALMVIGALIVAFGLVGLSLPMYFGIESLTLTPRLVVPLSQWSAYLVVLTGAAFLAGGLPRSGPDRKRYAQEMQEISSRAHAMELALTDMEARMQEQCVLAEVNDADPITLDAVEILLDREREKCATDERMQLDLEQLEAEHDEAHTKLRIRRQELSAAQQQEQRALLKWHDCLRAHHVENVPSHDAAAAFFARVEAALVAQASAQSHEEEVAHLIRSIEEHREKLCAMEAVMHILRGNPPPTPPESAAHEAQPSLQLNLESPIEQEHTSDAKDTIPKPLVVEAEAVPTAPQFSLAQVLAAVQTVLDMCREADEALAERLKAENTVHNCMYSLEVAEKTQAEMVLTLQKSETTLQEISDSWQHALQDMGMDKEISPRMLRSILECMEKCLAMEADILRLQEEKDRMLRECESLVSPLRAILLHMQKEEPQSVHTTDIPYQEDWLSALDALLAQVQESYEAQQLREQVQGQLRAQIEELQEANTALQDANATIQHLLQLGQINNIEEFIRLSHIRGQRMELLRRRNDLEDALRLAAGEQELNAFLQSFAQREKHECELFLQQKEAELQELLTQEQEKMHAHAQVSATLHTIMNTDFLAKLRQEERDIQENLQSAGMQWAQYAVAKHMLLQAKQRFEQERQPQVIRMASDIFAQITQEKWKGLTASLEESSLQVISPFGEPVSPSVLSRGTQEQLYLALRLAYIRNHAAHAQALPVIMDDILVNFDPERAEHTAEALLDLSQSGKKHQILFFTCHPHMADMLQKNAKNSTRFMVENAQIIPA